MHNIAEYVYVKSIIEGRIGSWYSIPVTSSDLDDSMTDYWVEYESI